MAHRIFAGEAYDTESLESTSDFFMYCIYASSSTSYLFVVVVVILIGPGVLACATRGGGRSEAGHCFHLLFSFFLFLFFFFFFLRLLLFIHFGESPVREN